MADVGRGAIIVPASFGFMEPPRFMVWRCVGVDMDDILDGEELKEFVSSRFVELAAARGLVNPACRVVDHGRGLRSWSGVGAATIVWPPEAVDPRVASYDRIKDQRPSAVEAQIQTHVEMHVARTFDLPGDRLRPNGE